MSFRPFVPSANLPEGWTATALIDVVLTRSGNSKIIKGTLTAAARPGLFQAFSASGPDVWATTYEHELTALVLSAVGARCGKVFLARGKWVAIANTHVVIPLEGVNPRFLWYGLNDENFWIRSGSAQPFVAVNRSLERIFALPPAEEQTRIVDKLEELLSDLDAGVAELKAAQKKLAQYRQSLLKVAVEGRLTEAWRAQHGEPEESGAQLLARILRERRARWEAKQLAKFKAQCQTPPLGWEGKYQEPARVDADALPKLPLGWAWARAEQLCDFITKGTTPPKGLDAGLNRAVPFLRVTNLTSEGTLNLDDKVFVSEHTHRGLLARSVVYPGDVLMNIVGPPLGQVSVVPVTFAEWNIN